MSAASLRPDPPSRSERRDQRDIEPGRVCTAPEEPCGIRRKEPVTPTRRPSLGSRLALRVDPPDTDRISPSDVGPSSIDRVNADERQVGLATSNASKVRS